MITKCVAFGCCGGYDTTSEKVSTFYFPLGKSDFLEKWVNFVNCNELYPTKNSVLSIKDFDEKSILKGHQYKQN